MGILLFKAPEVTLLCSHDENLCVRERRFLGSVSSLLEGKGKAGGTGDAFGKCLGHLGEYV